MSDPNTHASGPSGSQARQGVAESTGPSGPGAQATGDQAPGAQAPAAPTAPQAAPRSSARAPKQGGLSTFLKVSIVLLAGLTVASISLLFIGDFEGKFERVFSTFALFAVFVLFTALDTRREQKSEWYAPVALIANSYILALLLIVIWMTPYESFGLMFEIFWKSVFVILTTRLVILCCQLLLRAGDRLPAAVTRFAFATSVLAVLSGILFTAPVGIDAFDLNIPDLYWRIATALLILTALGLSITLLLRWSYGAEHREARRAAERAHLAHGAVVDNRAFPAQQAVPAQPAPLAQPAPQAVAPDGQPLLPWPTFADGTPLPAGPDGQPDFSVVQQRPGN